VRAVITGCRWKIERRWPGMAASRQKTRTALFRPFITHQHRHHHHHHLHTHSTKIMMMMTAPGIRPLDVSPTVKIRKIIKKSLFFLLNFPDYFIGTDVKRERKSKLFLQKQNKKNEITMAESLDTHSNWGGWAVHLEEPK
jgi:hypothetical protein